MLGKQQALKGKSFLAEKDFTEEELLYFLDLAEELKEKRKKAFRTVICKEKILHYYLKKHLRGQDAHSPWRALIWVRILSIWARMTFN